ncbi:MAG TPA: ribonuclease P protein component [Candidatus Baltobacteraceae bacterium]|nr:ribonuclease P protein component [Candidatus Baltobacteraceae bacterium]
MRHYASLRRSADFSRLRQRGRRVASGVLTIYRAEPLASDLRCVVGITVGKPVGKAVVRNTVRRRIGAILQNALEGRRLRLLVVARPGAGEAPFIQLKRDIERALAGR